MPVSTLFRIKKHDSIGNPSAESDGNYLSHCFVDTGDLQHLRDCTDERGIILGRTGAGKTALLKTLLERGERVIEVEPQNLALGYISNSTIIKFYESLGVKMDLFYQFLWRHVLLVEILKRHFGLHSEEDKLALFDKLRYTILRKRAHLDAFEYLNKWGAKFWETTEDRIKEITQRVETELKAGTNVTLHPLLTLGVEGARRLSEEQRREVIQHGQNVINQTQMSKLSLLFEALDEEILTDPQKRYYVVIDRLDEYWVDDDTRYRLIRALIETMREFNRKIRYTKILLALRTDLLDRVLKATTDAGFQDEKYRGLCFPITWSRTSLEELLNLRIHELVRHRYNSRRVTHRELLPATLGEGKEPALTYLLDRTLLRPRDLIVFFNLCMANAEGAARLQESQVLKAEGLYSLARLKSLDNEWSVHYPYLSVLYSLLKKRHSAFKLGEIHGGQLNDACLEVLVTDPSTPGEDVDQFQAFFDEKINAATLRVFIAQVLYRVGAVGLKTETFNEVIWSASGQEVVSPAEINDQTIVHVHKMFWRGLGIAT